MKKIISLCMCLLFFMLCLVGCSYEYFFTTSDYKSYSYFAKNHKPGMTKQEIIDDIGCPKGYFDAQGDYHILEIKDIDNFEANLSSDSSVAWDYACHQYPDPANPYYLKITFDSEGKSLSVKMTASGG